MNVRELIDTLEAKCDLLASQDEREGRLATLRQLEGHLDEMRDTLGLPCGEPSCCSCSLEPFLRCPDCGGQFCEGCGDVQDGEFVCDVCREDREMAQEHEVGGEGAASGSEVTAGDILQVDVEAAAR